MGIFIFLPNHSFKKRASDTLLTCTVRNTTPLADENNVFVYCQTSSVNHYTTDPHHGFGMRFVIYNKPLTYLIFIFLPNHSFKKRASDTLLTCTVRNTTPLADENNVFVYCQTSSVHNI